MGLAGSTSTSNTRKCFSPICLVSYTLLADAFHGEIPHQCLNDCVYTVSGTSSPKFCFETGDLPTECLSEAAGSTGPPVHAGVQVKSATTGGALSNVTVKLIVDNLDHFSTTDDQGIAISHSALHQANWSPSKW